MSKHKPQRCEDCNRWFRPSSAGASLLYCESCRGARADQLRRPRRDDQDESYIEIIVHDHSDPNPDEALLDEWDG